MLADCTALVGFDKFFFEHTGKAARKVSGQVEGLTMTLSWSLFSLPPPAYHKTLGRAQHGRAAYRDILADLW